MSDARSFETNFDADSRSTRFAMALFGDRVGLAVFLAALLLFTVIWIVAWRINDSLTLLNTLAGMSDGQLYITEVKYGTNVGTPGTHEVGEQVFGRNYGILAVSLVPLFAIEAMTYVFDLRIALAGFFSLGVLALALVLGRIVGRKHQAGLFGGLLALALFVGNVAVATDLDPARTELYALQLTHVIATGFLVVFAYRLLAAMHGNRAGLFAATLVALATPTSLWSSIPKRHVFSAGIVVLLAYALYRSRVAERQEAGAGLKYRAGAYAALGLFAWVHAPEALLLLIVFAAVDVPTARTSLRSLATIGVSMAIATVPFLVTNYLISGSAVKPPRMLSKAGGSTGEPSFGDGGGGGGGGGGLLDPLLGIVDPMLAPLLALADLFRESLTNLLTSPGEILTIFVRSGYLGGRAAERANFESVNLAVLESAPILVATLGVLPAAVAFARRRERNWFAWPPGPARTVDAYLVLATVAFSLLYVARLPLHAQITVRYVLPIFPALAVLLVRLPAVRGVLDGHWRLLLWTYAIAVFIGGQFLVVALVLIDPGVGEAFQFHAWIALATAVPVAAWSLSGRHDGWWGRFGAISIALATAAVTVFLLMLTLDYFTVGNAQALPLVRAIAEVVSIT